ncbi:DNA primase [Synechococcus sp. CS-1328]|uniref:DNA primase n=1 Tax=Synechococcus sp. CS-1328 TaxID=2847976 RepID=UPI00223AE5FC|nr:CHC2 zinc finger domain-containing protein [Synechococcus sp. CS-1328]MCT0225599.1 toprim domain-containing protein [Synechococcus sp. CS-1328]
MPLSPGERGTGLRVSPDLLEAVRERSRIVDLFPAAELRRAGREFLARCPWHDDRRPSLTVSPARNRVHCFVCARGTDPIGWLQDRQGLSFQEAVLELAQRYGIPLPQDDPEAATRLEQERRQRRRLLDQRQRQREQFQRELQRQLDHGGPGADYLRQRGISAESATTWQLGLAGGRLTIPLSDPGGQCVAFCGRAIAGQEPKYRNSPADLLFQRNGLVFGLDRAAALIRKEGVALLVEGPLDVIQLHQAGYPLAVASLGTGLSPLQLHLLRRQGLKLLLIAYDGDRAGRTATLRLLEQLTPDLVSGALGAAVLVLPEGEDADGLLRRQGRAALEPLLAEARHWLEWRLEQLLAPRHGQAAAGGVVALEVLQQVEREGQALAAQLSEGVLRRTVEQRLEQALRNVQGSVRQGGSDVARQGGSAGISPMEPVAGFPSLTADSPALLPPATTARERVERRALRLFIHAPDCRAPLLCLPLDDPACRAAMDWASNLAIAVAEDQLPAALLQLSVKLPGQTGALLHQAAAPGEELLQLLRRDPQAELKAVMDWLEPVEGLTNGGGGVESTA